MRYQNWDVLVFPGTSKVPIREFKTACNVVQDSAAEYLPFQGNTALLPTVTSFIPGLAQGSDFRLSIHSWETPKPSRMIQTFSKHAEQVMFEARVFIDGKLAGCRFFGRDGPWPTVISTGLAVDKEGEVDTLKFPAFHPELLAQTYWDAGDEYGRIKVIISEGFFRDSATMPFERVKNSVAFSFQHAPLDVLESSNIAWPNTAMWHQVSCRPGVAAAPCVQEHPSDDATEVHSHSPRRRGVSSIDQHVPPPAMGMFAPPAMGTMRPSFTRSTHQDPFGGTQFASWRQASLTDISMPDYSNSASQVSHSRQFTDPVFSEKAEKAEAQYESLKHDGAFEGLCDALLPVREAQGTGEHGGEAAVPDDTIPPTAKSSGNGQETPVSDVAAANTGSIRSRKESGRKPSGQKPALDGPEATESRTPSSSIKPPNSVNAAGHKRQRLATPASAKAIDEEDEPKLAPGKSRVSSESGRRVLSELPNIQ